jgi:hypothetical protein
MESVGVPILAAAVSVLSDEERQGPLGSEAGTLESRERLIGRTAYNGRAAPEHIGWRQARLVGRKRPNGALA